MGSPLMTAALAAGLSLTVADGKYVGDKEWPHVNSVVTLYLNGSPILTTTYRQGVGWLSAEAQGRTVHAYEQRRKLDGWRKPDLDDVLYALLSDGACYFDGLGFEDWCLETGENNDSIKAEATYRECMEYGRKLYAALDASTLEGLREASRDF